MDRANARPMMNSAISGAKTAARKNQFSPDRSIFPQTDQSDLGRPDPLAKIFAGWRSPERLLEGAGKKASEP
jgi:hypothetical protein